MKKRILYFLTLSVMVASLSVPTKATSTDTNTTAYYGIMKVIYSPFTNENNNLSPKQHEGWVVAECVNVRNKSSTKSKKIGQLYFSEHINFYELNDDWVSILYDGKVGYVAKKYISTDEPKYKTYSVPYTKGNKSYMPHKKSRGKSIFSKTSDQYKLQQFCHTGNYGIRKYKNRFCVALGSAFGTDIGQYFDLVLKNGSIIKCIMADQKDDKHTDSSNIVTLHSGCASEFVVDNIYLDSTAKRMGDISFCTDDWDARVVKIRVYDKLAEHMEGINENKTDN